MKPFSQRAQDSTPDGEEPILLVSDEGKVRILTLNRPSALNAFTEALYDAVTVALHAAAEDESVAVVLLTGAGRAFSAGNDLGDMQARFSNPHYQPGIHGFEGMIKALVAFPKPFLCAVNGIAVGVGTTILGHADLVFMSANARLQCPFTALGVAPEAGSSYLMPALVGRQNAAWLLMSSEWIEAGQAHDMGLAWKICPPDQLLTTALEHAAVLASRSLPSLMAVKRTLMAPLQPLIEQANETEIAEFEQLLGGPANIDALRKFHERRPRT